MKRPVLYPSILPYKYPPILDPISPPKTFLLETFSILQHLGVLGTKYFIFRHAETFPKNNSQKFVT